MRLFALLAAVLALLVAGCARPEDSGPTEPANAEAKAMPVLALPCEADVGPETSANVQKLGQWRTEAGDLGEADVRGDLALLARHQLGGLYVIDIADPFDPKLVGTLEIEGTMGLDVKWTPSGDGALIGDFGQIHLVDLADPATPVLRGTFSYKDAGIKGQAHMVATRSIDGQEWVFVASQSNNAPMYILVREGWNLTYKASYGMLPVLASTPLGNHDITILNDTLLGDKPLLYLAEGFGGWSVHDVSKPDAPVRLGGSFSPEPGPGYTHTVRVGFYDGKRIVVTMSEVGLNTMKVYDATDLAKPILLARWNADTTRPQIPQHNIQLLGDHLYMGHYTEGVYVFNLSGVVSGPPVLGSLELAPMAHYAVEEPEKPSELGFANVWEVLVHHGAIWVTDGVGTFTSVGFGCVTLGDPAVTATE